MGSPLQWSRQVANQLFPQTSPLIPAHLLLPKTLTVTSKPSNSDFNSPTSRWPLLQPRPPLTHTTRAVWSMRSPPLLSEPPSWHPDGKDPSVFAASPTSINGLERTIHINHAKPAKFTAPDFPEPVPPIEVPRPPLGYLPTGFAQKPTKPRAPPVNPNEASMAPPAAPAVPIARPPAATPANQHPEPSPPRLQSPRLNPEQGQAHAILSRPAAFQHHSQPRSRTANHSEMANVYPLTIGFTEVIGPKENPLSFTSLRLVDLSNGQSQYLSTMKKLTDALAKTKDPASCFALRGHIARPGQPRLHHSMRATLWFLLPSDGTFLCDFSSLRYYLARQGRRAVLRGGDVTRRPWENHLNWIPDPAPNPSRDHGKMMEKKEENRPLHLSHPRCPERYGPGGERESIASSIFQDPMKTLLELTSDPGGWSGRQWSIPSLPSFHSIHSIPAKQPIRIRPGSIPGTKLILASYIRRPKEAEARNPPNNLVETTSPDHLPPSALNGLVETTSLGPHHSPELAKVLT